MSEEDACVLNIEENYSDSEFPLIHDTDTDNESETEGNAENAVAAGYSGVYNWDSDSEEEDDLPKLRYRSRKRKEISSDTDSSDQEQGNDSDRRTENGTSHDEEGDEESDANSASHDEDRREHSDNVEIESNQQVSDSDDASHMDIKTITQIFRKKLKTYSISQRMAARLILKCSQSTVSELYAKAERHVTSKELSVRGKEPYQKMQEWLASEKLQKETRTAVAQQRGIYI